MLNTRKRANLVKNDKASGVDMENRNSNHAATSKKSKKMPSKISDGSQTKAVNKRERKELYDAVFEEEENVVSMHIEASDGELDSESDSSDEEMEPDESVSS